MNEVDVINQMKHLWKSTFNDSDEYIDMLFSHYFKAGNIACKAVSNDIVSSLFGIEYKFIYSCDNVYENYDNGVKSMYLCGLATDPKYRGKGVMTHLINDFCKTLFNRDIAFVFLIPANDGLIKYYEDRDFVCASFNCYSRYIKGNNFICNIRDKNALSEYKIDNICDDILLFKSANISSYENILFELSEYIARKNNVKSALSILKTPRDLDAIIIDNVLSKGCIHVLRNSDDIIKGVVFAQANEFNNVNVQLLLHDDELCGKLLLQAVQNHYGDNADITVTYSADITNSDKVFAPYSLTYSPVYDMGEIKAHDEVFSMSQSAKPYAMARIIKLSEVLIFAAALYPGRKYSILVTHDFIPENCGFYEVYDGKCRFTPLEDISGDRLDDLIHKCDAEADYYHLTLPELAALLWRKKGNSVIDDVIAIPRLPLNISLMLD